MPNQQYNTAGLDKEKLKAKVKELFRETSQKQTDIKARGLTSLGILKARGAAHSLLTLSSIKRFSPCAASTAREVGEAIKLRRKDLGLTQIELADKAGTGVRLVGEIENGKETAEVGKVLDLLDALGLEVKLAPKG